MTKADPLVYMATTDSAWAKGRITVMLPSGQVLQQFGDADDKTEAGKRLTNPHSVAVAPGCRSVIVPELSKRIACFTLTAPERHHPPTHLRLARYCLACWPPMTRYQVLRTEMLPPLNPHDIYIYIWRKLFSSVRD